jgi:histidinol-phosphatase
VNVRPATQADRETLLALWEEFADDSVPAWVPDARDGTAAGIDRSIAFEAAYLAERDGETVGFAAAVPYGQGAAELVELYVRPPARRAGVAAALLREVTAALRRAGVEYVFVSTGADNAAALAVYERWGFAPHMVELITTVDELERALVRRPQVDADLAFALSLADEADAITLARFRAHDLRVDTKPDLTPVSEADRAVEERLRERIAAERPGDRVLGEELGADAGEGDLWIVDPIDATKNYVRGIPIFATLLALEERVAVVSAPALGRRWWATRGGGAFTNGGRRLAVSKVARIEDAVLAYTSLSGWDERFLALARRAWAARSYGDFWQYMLLAEGGADACAERIAEHWDLAAPKLIVEEAGGRLTDLDGEVRADGGNSVASNGLLHEEVLNALSAELVE